MSRTDVNVERVRQMLQSDHRLSVRVIADELGLGKSSLADYHRRFEHKEGARQEGTLSARHEARHVGCQLVTAIAMITRRLTIPECLRVFGR